MLLQMQGMISEYERAKIMERNRRGKLHGAKRGSINVLSTAPFGYRYIRKQLDGAPAQYVIELPQAATVRTIFQCIRVERLSIGEVIRRLAAKGFATATGKPYWDRSESYGRTTGAYACAPVLNSTICVKSTSLRPDTQTYLTTNYFVEPSAFAMALRRRRSGPPPDSGRSS